VFSTFIEDEDYVESVSAIVYHAYADPWFDINSTEHRQPFTYYGVTGIPHCKVDGIIGIHPGNATNLTGAYNQRIVIDSPLRFYVNVVSLEGEIATEIMVVNSGVTITEDDQYVFRAALVSNHYEWDEATNDQTDWHYDLLDFAPDFNGVSFTISADTVAFYEATFDWPIEIFDENVEEDNASILFWVQNNNEDDGDYFKEVIQSEMTSFTPDGFPEYLMGFGTEMPYHYVETSATTTFAFEVDNLGSESDTYDISVNADGFPEGWSFNYTTPDGEQTGSSTLTLETMEEYISTVTFETNEIPGNSGEISFILTSQGDTTITEAITYYIQTWSDILIINGDPEGRYLDYFAEAIDSVGELDEVIEYGVWGYADRQLDMDELIASDATLVLWVQGQDGTIDASAQEGLNGYLESGGSLVIAGSEAPALLDGSDLIETMGAGFQASVTDRFTINGFDDDPITGGLRFGFGSGDGAGYFGYPSSMTITGTGTGSMMFGTTDFLRAAVLNETDTYKSYLMGIPFECINSKEARVAIMLGIMVHMAGYTYGEDITPEAAMLLIPEEYAIEQNYPNPFNPTTEITFSLPENAQVTITVYDLAGREVTRLVDSNYQAGQHHVEWSAENNASGIYFYRFAAVGEQDSFTGTRKMLLVK